MPLSLPLGTALWTLFQLQYPIASPANPIHRSRIPVSLPSQLDEDLEPMDGGTSGSGLPTGAKSITIQFTGSSLTYYDGMKARFEDGTVQSGWNIPAGKTLVITQVSMRVFMSWIIPNDMNLIVTHSYPYPEAAFFPLMSVKVRAGQQQAVAHQVFPSGFTLSSAQLPLSIALMHDDQCPVPISSIDFFATGYLRDSN